MEEGDWTSYNKAQTQEKILFYKLVDELLNIIPERPPKFGRPKKSLRDMLFCCLIKSYHNTSARRTISELQLAKEKRYISEVPHFNTLLNYFEDADMDVILNYLITISSLPLRQVETKFAHDSTGFGTQSFDRWARDKTLLGNKVSRGYMKAHVTCGIFTNIITAAEITDERVNDHKMFKPAIEKTNEHFKINEVSADKAYSSKVNMNLVNQLGAIPYIPFKSNSIENSRGSPTWSRMYKMFTLRYEEFMKHYHKRSNVESTFAMIKRKYGGFCRCKSFVSRKNEILSKILVHNIVVLIHEIFNLEIEINFLDCAKLVVAQKVA